MKTELKRQNFNVTPEQEAEIAWLREAINAPTTKDAILWAVRVLSTLARETKQGKSIYLANESGEKERLMLPQIGAPLPREDWKYLIRRPNTWRRQLFVKGRKLLASDVWSDMIANNMTRQEIAEDWDLPLEAIDELIAYCEQNRALIAMEADEERRGLPAEGAELEPAASR
ncbi:MAG: hypothetical protein M1133_06615 [Armatimonadetes bacterium]|nr:hypothetical protein [Armatimonadota bacterium]